MAEFLVNLFYILLFFAGLLCGKVATSAVIDT